MNIGMSVKFRHPEGENGYIVDTCISRLEASVSCTCRCFFHSIGTYFLREGGLDHSITFASKQLSSAKCNYTTIEIEGLAMVYALQKFRHYLLGAHFKMFTDHSALKYLGNKPMLGGKICRCLLLFQEYGFDIIVKLGRLNARPNHLSRLESREEPKSLEDHLPNA